MTKALFVIDYTNDFVATDGALTCGQPGQTLEKPIYNLIKKFHDEDDYIFFINDLHYVDDPNHPETQLFPPHNILDTYGRELYASIQVLFDEIKNQQKVFNLAKTRYSIFAGTALQQLLTERNISELHLVGVCTDICILHSAMDAYNLGYKNTIIHKSGVASFNKQGHDWALQHFTNSLGFKVHD
ncbi:cysteine hydrolase family protein [Kurthia sibirica]|uniref:Isochorismatase n=1 Tax=Kurthia sibirica TaxID=202750 RepID=A0A2U3ALI6_9BACL|nr:isochorismatase family cysteine hydrolase [Kurthia sibirica]PWI25406.1 isochorismatase [Kurthia sibirica]GEK34359.1 isochorismatase [Kurthia sibirica]